MPARSLLKLASQSAQIAGNAFGGALVVAFTPRGAMLVNAGSFLFSAAVVRLGVRDYQQTGEPDRAGLLRDSLRGARGIFGRAELRRLLLLGWLVPMTLQGIGFALAGAIAQAIGAPGAIVTAGALGLTATALLTRTDLRATRNSHRGELGQPEPGRP